LAITPLQVAILQVVFDVQLLRRRQSAEMERVQQQAGPQGQLGKGEGVPGASTTTSVGSTVM
jgi:hypothetical protein